MKNIIVYTLAMLSLAACGGAPSTSDLQSARHTAQKPRIAYAINATLGNVRTDAARGPAVGMWTTIELEYEVPCAQKFETFNYALRAREDGGTDLLASAVVTRADFNGPHCLSLQLARKDVVVPGLLTRDSIHLVNLDGGEESLQTTTKSLVATGLALQGVRSLCPADAMCAVGGTIVTLKTTEGVSCVDKIAPVTYAAEIGANGKVKLAAGALNMIDSRLVRCASMPRNVEISLPNVYVNSVDDIDLTVVGGN